MDTTNKIFKISCGAEFALKLIGRKNCAYVSCACLSMGGSHALFGAPTPFWSSRPHLEISRLQLYPTSQIQLSSFALLLGTSHHISVDLWVIFLSASVCNGLKRVREADVMWMRIVWSWGT